MNLRKFFGFLFVIAAAVGMIFSILGLIQVWRYRPGVTQTAMDNLVLIAQALNTTQDGLTIVSHVVQTITVDIASLQTTTQALAWAIHDTNPMLDSLTILTGNDFPATITATQTSLASAQSSALLIDNVLTALTSIPFSPIATYQPDVPLHTALTQVSTSLNGLMPALATINTSLTDGKRNLGVVEAELNKISATTEGISNTLGSAQTVIAEYQAVTTQLKRQVDAAQKAASGWVTTTAWILSFVLTWLLIAQLGLGAQGMDMLRSRREAK